MDRTPDRRWSSLTGELGRATSPVKVYFHTRFPNVGGLQRQYRDDAGPLILPGTNRLPGTIGAAFDWSVRFLLHPQPSLALALQGAARLPPKMGVRDSRRLALAIVQLAGLLGVEPTREGTAGMGVPTFQGPAQESVIEEELLLRGCWALALLAEAYRIGPVPLPPGSPLHTLDLQTIDADALLDLATPETIAELAELRSLARAKLLPHLTERTGLWALGPTFEGSKLMSADADLIAGGLLVELKTGLGDRRRDGTRRCGLETKTLYQLIGYVLLDFDDAYRVDGVSLYEGRYGHFATWNLQDLLDETAGRHVDRAEERDQLRTLLA